MASTINPLRLDPSRTGQIRRAYSTEINARFNALIRDINKLLIEEDAFGVRANRNAGKRVFNSECGAGSKGNPGFQKGNDCARGGGRSLVSETDYDHADILLTQGIRPDFKREMNVDEYAPGKGIDRGGLYVVDEKELKSLALGYGNVRLYLNVDEKNLDVPPEMKQLGYAKGKEVAGEQSLDYVLKSVNGGVTTGELPPSVFSRVEVYTGGSWQTMSPDDYLASRGIAGTPRLPSMREYEQTLRDNADKWFLDEDRIQSALTEYNRAKLKDKVSLAEEAGLINNSDCGAGKPGSPGFQPGNTCARGGETADEFLRSRTAGEVEVYDRKTGDLYQKMLADDARQALREAQSNGENLTDYAIRPVTPDTERERELEQQRFWDKKQQDADKARLIESLKTGHGLKPGHPDYVEPPEQLYHATFYAEEIRETGFKTSDEVGKMTLGGTTSDYVSFTTKENAEHYRDALNVARRAAKGEIDDAEFITLATRYGVSSKRAREILRDRRDITDPYKRSFQLWQDVSFEGKQFPLFVGSDWRGIESTQPADVVSIPSEGITDILYNPGESEWRVGGSDARRFVANASDCGAGKEGSPGFQPGNDCAASRGDLAKRFPRVRSSRQLVDGRKVLKDVPNTSSIASSLTDYEVMPGIREIDAVKEFGFPRKSMPYSVSEANRVRELAEKIKKSGKISPLIVVLDREGPYILEGGHRFDALSILEAKAFPAMVVIDRSEDVGIPITNSDCGAGSPGNPGFQPGNDCARGSIRVVSKNKEVAKQLNQEAARLLREYPQLRNLPDVIVETLEGKSFRQNTDLAPDSDLYGAYHAHSRTQSKGKDKITIAEGLDKTGESRVGGFNVGQDLATAFRHELGHHIENHITLPVDPDTGRRISWRNISAPFIGKDKEILVSDYARNNYKEMLAESFAVYTDKNYRRGSLPKPIERWLDLYLLPEETTANTRWRFQSSPQQYESFMLWLRQQIAHRVLQGKRRDDTDTWFQKYINRTYAKGFERAFDQVRKKDKLLTKRLGFYEGTKEEFLRSAFSHPVSIDRVKLLASRSFEEYSGLNEQMATAVGRELVDGMIRGDGPREVARNIAKQVGISRKRALMIARTETLRAHNNGALDSMERMGVTRVGVAVEWSTSKIGVTKAGNPSPCKLCAPLEGMVLTISEARWMFPRHPNCLTGDAVVVADDVLSVMKANYTGEIFEFVTAKGCKLSVTKNHILLSECGLLPAKNIYKGLKVFNAPSANTNPIEAPNNQRYKTSISDIFTSLSESESMISYSVPLSPKNLHGDGKLCQGEIDIVTPNCELWYEIERTQFPELSLIPLKFIHRESPLSALSPVSLFLRCVAFASDSSMGRFRDLLAIFLGRLLEANQHSFSKSSGSFPVFDEDTVDCSPVYTKPFRNCLNRHPVLKQLQHFSDGELFSFLRRGQISKLSNPKIDPCLFESSCNKVLTNTQISSDYPSWNSALIETDEIVSINIKHVENLPVYDLSTKSTLYRVNGLVTSNCLCAVRPANVGESQEGQKRTRKAILQAINDSLRAEIPKKDKKRTLAEQRKLSWWVGAGKSISKNRPQPIVSPTVRTKRKGK